MSRLKHLISFQLYTWITVIFSNSFRRTGHGGQCASLVSSTIPRWYSVVNPCLCGVQTIVVVFLSLSLPSGDQRLSYSLQLTFMFVSSRIHNSLLFGSIAVRWQCSFFQDRGLVQIFMICCRFPLSVYLIFLLDFYSVATYVSLQFMLLFHSLCSIGS